MSKSINFIILAGLKVLVLGFTLTTVSSNSVYAWSDTDEKKQFCSDYRVDSGYNCQIERCPCGRGEKELKRWDRSGLKLSLCACVSAAQYDLYQERVEEERNKNRCNTDADCNDGVFCNGEETCKIDGIRTSAGNGHCEPGQPPCEEGAVCFEREDMCKVQCEDKDGDGYKAMHCGGDDCDDNNPNRSPGNEEICDSDGIDEDCDARTVGFLDEDGDGFISQQCR